MRLSRHSLKYFLNYYLPSGLFVMVSWVSIKIQTGSLMAGLLLAALLFPGLQFVCKICYSLSGNLSWLIAVFASFKSANTVFPC